MGRPFWSVVLAEKEKRRQEEERKRNEDAEMSEHGWGTAGRDGAGLWGTADAGLWSPVNSGGWGADSASSWHDTNVSSWGNGGEIVENMWGPTATTTTNSSASDSPAGRLRSENQVPTRQCTCLYFILRNILIQVLVVTHRSRSPRRSRSPHGSSQRSRSPRRS